MAPAKKATLGVQRVLMAHKYTPIPEMAERNVKTERGATVPVVNYKADAGK
ncbi:MAG: hypothetical protein WKF84_13615 [Pyrinomonadaceae bacterium]